MIIIFILISFTQIDYLRQVDSCYDERHVSFPLLGTNSAATPDSTVKVLSCEEGN